MALTTMYVHLFSHYSLNVESSYKKENVLYENSHFFLHRLQIFFCFCLISQSIDEHIHNINIYYDTIFIYLKHIFIKTSNLPIIILNFYQLRDNSRLVYLISSLLEWSLVVYFENCSCMLSKWKCRSNMLNFNRKFLFKVLLKLVFSD